MTRPRQHDPEQAAAAGEHAAQVAAGHPDPETETRAGHRGGHITSGGVELTDALTDALTAEAEAGYDLEKLRPRPRPQDT
jgi:hypothetical protein